MCVALLWQVSLSCRLLPFLTCCFMFTTRDLIITINTCMKLYFTERWWLNSNFEQDVFLYISLPAFLMLYHIQISVLFNIFYSCNDIIYTFWFEGDYWQEWNAIFIIPWMVSYLKLRVIVFCRMRLLYLRRSRFLSTMLHNQVSTRFRHHFLPANKNAADLTGCCF